MITKKFTLVSLYNKRLEFHNCCNKKLQVNQQKFFSQLLLFLEKANKCQKCCTGLLIELRPLHYKIRMSAIHISRLEEREIREKFYLYRVFQNYVAYPTYRF